MNALAVGTPASTTAGRSAIGSPIAPATTRLSATSIAASADVAACHSAQAHPERRLGRGRRSGPGVVEGEQRRRPAERRRDRVLEEAIGLGVAGDPCVRMDVDAAGQDEEARRVDDLPGTLGGGRPIGRIEHRRDPVSVDRHVGQPGASGGDDRPAPDQEVHAGRIRRARRWRSAARPPRGSGDRPRGGGPASRRPARSWRSDWPPAGRPWSSSCRPRRGRRSRTR